LNTTFKDLIDVSSLGRVRLNTEVHECNFQFQKLAHFHVLSLLVDNLIGVLLEQAENIHLFVHLSHEFSFSSGLRLASELREFIHKTDENILDIYVNIKVTSSVKELFESLQMPSIREGLYDTFHKVLLRHGVFTNDNDIKDAR
jgi:hypothetical protein